MASWESLGGGFRSGPGAASWARGRLDVVGRGLDDACWHRSCEGGTWSDWGSLGGGFTSEPDAVSWGPGRLDVVGRGQDDACWHTSWEGAGWGGWESLGGRFATGIGAASWGPGRLDLFGQATDGACWHKWFDGGWSDWQSLGGGFTSELDAVSWGTGRIDVVGRGQDNACWHSWWDGSAWAGWESLGGQFGSGITASSWAPGRLDLFGLGVDGACWHKWFEGGWSDWESLGGVFTSSFAAVSWDVGRIDVVGRGADDAFWRTWFDGGAWADWSTPAAAVPLAMGASLRLAVHQVVRLQAIALPTFDAAAGATLQGAPTGDVPAVDGTRWRSLVGWVEPSADGRDATVLCRRTGLSIRIPAKGTGSKLLPFADGSPDVALAYSTGSGEARTRTEVPMEAAVDVENGFLMAVLPFDTPQAYGDMVDVLSDSGSDVRLEVDFGHRFLVQQPGDPTPGGGGIETPPTIPPRWPVEVVVRDHRRPDVIVRDHRRRRLVGALRPVERVAAVRAAVTTAEPVLLTAALAPQVRASMLRNPAVLDRLRLGARDWSRVVIEPERRPGGPRTSENVLVSAFDVAVHRPVTDVAVYPDQPRVSRQGWGQVPGRGPDKPVLHFKDSDRADVFFILPTRFKLGFFRGADPDGGDDLAPIRVHQYLDAAQRYRVAVALVAVPFLDDADRVELATHIREVVLRRMLPFVSLEPRAGLRASFVSQFSAGAGEAREVLPETITFTAEEVLPDRRLTLRFDMDALHYGLFCELLRKGIRGRVVLQEDGLNESIDVSLRLDDLVTNGVQLESEGFDAPPPAASEGAEPPAPRHGVRLRNTLAYPARLSMLQVTCIDRGRVAGMVFDAEPLDLLSGEQVLAPRGADAASAGFEVRPQRIAVWNDTAVSLGTTRVDGGTVQDWLDRVTRDPTLQPQRHAVRITPVVPAGADVKVVRLRVLAAGQVGVRQAMDILPTGSSELVLELRLADLAAAGGTPLSFELEYDCEYGDGDLSLAQRVGLSPAVRDLPLSVLHEQPTSVYTVEHGPAGGAVTVRDGLDRGAASAVVDEARARGDRWRVFARPAGSGPAPRPQPEPQPEPRPEPAPDADPQPPTPSAGATGTYTVRAGDTLSSIATRLGVPGGWRALHEANRAVIGDDPGRIAPGMVLTVPAA